MEKYQKLKKRFKHKVEHALYVRASFNKNMFQDIYTTATTVNEEDVDDAKDKLKNIVALKSKIDVNKFNFKAEIQRPYLRIFLMILLMSIIGFICIAAAASQSSYKYFIGPYVIISKGSAGAVLTTCSFMMISVSYDLLS